MDTVNKYAYVVIVRPTLSGAYAEVVDVSHMVGQDLEGMCAANRACLRMGETPPYNIKEHANYISVLNLRARLNNAEGPFLVKSEEPIEGDVWDTLVRDDHFMDRLRKEGRL